VKRGTERILTTHVGSLTRPPEIVDAIAASVNNEPYNEESFAESLRQGVLEVVRKQAEVGVDVISDGEIGKSGFAAHINERLIGFERRPGKPGESEVSRGKDLADFLAFNQEHDRITAAHRPVTARWLARDPSSIIRGPSRSISPFSRPRSRVSAEM